MPVLLIEKDTQSSSAHHFELYQTKGAGVVKDIIAQIRRGIKSTGFLIAVVLQLFALTYVHMDAGLFWQNPLEYFKCGDFYYTFLISTEQGLSWLIVPIAAIMPFGFVFVDDKQSGYINLVLYRQDRKKYVIHRAIVACITSAIAMLLALSFYTGFIAIVTPWTNVGTGWQELASAAPYKWRASDEYFFVLVFECFGRLIFSSMIWALYGLSMSNIWQNRIFVTISVIATNLFLESYIPMKIGAMNSLSYLQIPQCGSSQFLSVSLIKQTVYFAISLVMFGTTSVLRFSTKVHSISEKNRSFISCRRNTRIGLWNDQIGKMKMGKFTAELRACCSIKTLCWSAMTGWFVVFLSSNAQNVKYSVGDVLIECYGGMEWADPVINFSAIARWILLLLPVALGVAINLEREFGARSFITLNRYGSKTSWWTYKCAAQIVYVILCVTIMMLATILSSHFTGAEGFAVYGEDGDGFSILRTDIVWATAILFICHVLMLTQFQVFVHTLFNDARMGLIAYTIPPVVFCIMASNIDHIWNEKVPYNWGMILRTNMNTINGYVIEGMDGVAEWLPQCCIQINRAFGYQIAATIILFVLNCILIQYINIASRKQRI